VWSPLAAGWLTGKYRRDEVPPADSRFGHAATTADEWQRLQASDVGTTIPHPHRIASEAEFAKVRKAREAERLWRIIDAVADVAAARAATSSQVALAWLLGRQGVTAPVLGVRTPAQLEDNLGCLDLTLSATERQWLDDVSDPGLPYPHDFWAQYGRPWR
jgi:aryl-alcohol dehydrogenase-like predicted oxidoreductase